MKYVVVLGAALHLVACGGSVEAPVAEGAPPSIVTPGKEPGGEAAAQAPAPVAPAAMCNSPASVTFSANIVDIAVDATHVWALVAPAADAWRVERAPKCGGAIELVGGESATQPNDFSGEATMPLRLGVSASTAVVLAWSASQSVVRLTRSAGGVTNNLMTTLYGPSHQPAFAPHGSGAMWVLNQDLHDTGLGLGDDRIVARQIATDQPKLDPHVDDLSVDGAFAFGTGAGRVFRVDVATQKVTRSGVLLMAEGKRLVRALAGAVFVIGADVARLSADLSQVQAFPLSEHGDPFDAALHPDYLFFTKPRSGGHSELYQMRNDGRAVQAVPAVPGEGGELAVDMAAVYVGRGKSVERIAIQPLPPR